MKESVEAIPKADYESRSKADMIAMLNCLDSRIDELATYNLEVAKAQRLIKYKIYKLKKRLKMGMMIDEILSVLAPSNTKSSDNS